MCRTGVVVMAVLLAGASAAGQSRDPAAQKAAAARGAVVTGSVVSADAGRPVPRAIVTIAAGPVTRSAEADEHGGFRLPDLPAGDYTLRVTKRGYVESIFGQKQPGSGRPGTTIRLAAAQELTGVTLPIARGSVITGAVVDEYVEAFFGAQVSAYRFVVRGGTRVLEAAGSTTTDDRGIYRIPLLRPGDYVIAARAGAGLGLDSEFVSGLMYVELLGEVDGRMGIITRNLSSDESRASPASGYAPIFYPGVMQAASAAPVTLAAGEERAGIDLRMQRVPIGRLAGTVTGPDGPVAGATVVLAEQDPIPGVGSRQARTTADGRFSFPGVAPGSYLLQASALPKGAKPLEASAQEAAAFLATVDESRRAQVAGALAGATPLWARAEVAADGRPEIDTLLQLQPGLTIPGHVVLDPAPPGPPALTRMSIALSPIGATGRSTALQAPPAPVQADGRFILRGVPPGQYTLRVTAGAPSGFSLQSAVVAGQDILDVPLVVRGDEQLPPIVATLSSRTTELSGTVRGPNGEPAAGLTVIAYPADERLWTPQSRRIQAVRPATDGRYAFRNLPPGDYRLVTVEDIEPGQWFDAAILRGFRGFVMVTIAPGGRHGQDLTAGPGLHLLVRYP